MLEVLMILTVLNTAAAAAALALALTGVKSVRGSGSAARGVEEDREQPFKLSDAKMREGIDNLMAYQPGNREEGG